MNQAVVVAPVMSMESALAAELKFAAVASGLEFTAVATELEFAAPAVGLVEFSGLSPLVLASWISWIELNLSHTISDARMGARPLSSHKMLDARLGARPMSS